MTKMRLALLPSILLIVLCLSSAVQALDDDGSVTEMRRRNRSRRSKQQPGGPKKPPPPPLKSSPPPLKSAPPTILSNDGLVAPLYRVNLPGFSVPFFVVELGLGSTSVPLNFTIDTMGRDTSLPSQFCSNASSSPRMQQLDTFVTTGNNKDNGNNNGNNKDNNNNWNNNNGNDKEKKASPPMSSPPVVLPSPPSSSSNTRLAYTVPCNHKVCQGLTYTCDKMRKRCMGFDRMTGKPVDIVLTQLNMQRVDASGSTTGQTRAVRGLVMGCSSASEATASLSPSSTSLVSQLTTAAGMPRKFAYCLGKPRGAFFVGGAERVFRQRDFKPAMQYLPMLTPPSAWQRGMGYRLALQAIAVGTGADIKPLPIDPSLFDKGIVIGTKARYTSLVDPAYQVVRRHFSKVAASSNASITPVPSPFPELNLCYKIPRGAAVVGAPKVQFIFENATLTVEPRNYIVRWRKTEIVCLGIVSSGPLGKVSVIGTLQQEETVVEFDLDKNVVGVSEPLTVTRNSCRNFAFLPERAWGGAPAPAPFQPHGSEEDDEFSSSSVDDELEAALSFVDESPVSPDMD